MKKITSFGGEDTKKECAVFGIDLGTTNSAISVVRSGDLPETIKLVNGRYTMPSCVMYEDNKVVVGLEAYQHRERPNTVYSVKRFMQDPTAEVSIPVGDEVRTLKPEEVSAEILKGLVEQTAGVFGEVKDVVVTVPAYFDQNGVSATKRACELAGLNLIGIANEPTAASLCYKLKPDEGNTKDVVVYDLGGGTFDVTLMRITYGDDTTGDLADIYGFEDEGGSNNAHSVVTLAIDGDTHLGGDDIDDALLKIVMRKLKKDAGVDAFKFTDEYLESMKLRLENFKKKDITSVYSFNIDTVDKSGNAVKTVIYVTPDDFQKATMQIFEKTRVIVNRILHSVPNNASTIVLTGGSTKNPIIQQALRDNYPSMQVDDALSPDLSVSQGAAIQGKVTKFGDSDVQIFDILPLTIGVKDADNRIVPVISKGSSLPAVQTVPFTTDRDNQERVGIELFQGASIYADECVSLGKLVLTGIQPRPAGEATLSVTISINADRLMTCIAMIDGRKEEITIDLSGDTSNKAVNKDDKQIRVLRRAGSHMSADKQAVLNDMLDNLGTKFTLEQVKTFIKENRSEKVACE